MGRKWTNVKFVLENRDGAVVEASSDPRSQEEQLYEFLRERWDSENVSPMNEIDVMFGGPSKEKLSRWLAEVFEACEFVERAAAVRVTDSAHFGVGLVFERSDEAGTTLTKIDEYTGYEQAKGHDAAGMIHDDYGIRVSADWYW